MSEEEPLPEEETPVSENENPEPEVITLEPEEESPEPDAEEPEPEEESPEPEVEILEPEEVSPEPETESPKPEEIPPDSPEEAPESEEDVPDSVEIEPSNNEVSGGDTPDIEADQVELEGEMAEFAELEGLTEEELAELEEEFSEDELLEIQEAMEENRQTETLDENGEVIPGEPGEELSGELAEPEVEFAPDIDDDLEKRMQEELAAKKKAQGVKTVTRDQFMQYLQERRNKIMYHALWHIVFNVDDHSIDKQSLYDVLKEVTSKNAVEVLEEHKFYFGLGFILRLRFLDQKVILFKKGKLNLNMSADMLQDLLQYIGPPISDRPIITDSEKKQMFSDFLNDDFLDI